MAHIFVISGPSRSGKNTIAKELLKDRFLNLAQAVTCTTRPPREDEKNGIHYYFLSISQFQEMIDDDGFIEWAQVHNHLNHFLELDRKSTRLNSNHRYISYSPFFFSKRSRIKFLWTRTSIVFFFFNDTATTEIYTLSLHDALPI